MRIHEQLGDNRIRFGQRLSEMSDELATLAKEVDKNRKQVRRVAIRVRFSVFPLPFLRTLSVFILLSPISFTPST